jgi:hypothetical protein
MIENDYLDRAEIAMIKSTVEIQLTRSKPMGERDLTETEIQQAYLADLAKLFAVRGGRDQELYESAEIQWIRFNDVHFVFRQEGLNPRFAKLFGESDLCLNVPLVCIVDRKLAIYVHLVDQYTVHIPPSSYHLRMIDQKAFDTLFAALGDYNKMYLMRRLGIVDVCRALAAPEWIHSVLNGPWDPSAKCWVLTNAVQNEIFREAIEAASEASQDAFTLNAFVNSQLPAAQRIRKKTR